MLQLIERASVAGLPPSRHDGRSLLWETSGVSEAERPDVGEQAEGQWNQKLDNGCVVHRNVIRSILNEYYT